MLITERIQKVDSCDLEDPTWELRRKLLKDVSFLVVLLKTIPSNPTPSVSAIVSMNDSAALRAEQPCFTKLF